MYISLTFARAVGSAGVTLGAGAITHSTGDGDALGPTWARLAL